MNADEWWRVAGRQYVNSLRMQQRRIRRRRMLGIASILIVVALILGFFVYLIVAVNHYGDVCEAQGGHVIALSGGRMMCVSQDGRILFS